MSRIPLSARLQWRAYTLGRAARELVCRARGHHEAAYVAPEGGWACVVCHRCDALWIEVAADDDPPDAEPVPLAERAS